MHFIWTSMQFLHYFCVSNTKKSDGKKLTPTQHLPNIACGTLPTIVLTPFKTHYAQSEIDFQDMCGSKNTLSGPINDQTLSSFSKIVESKHTPMHRCTTFPVSRLFHRFPYFLHGLALHAILIPCRKKSARIAHHNTLTVLCTLCTRFLPKA